MKFDVLNGDIINTKNVSFHDDVLTLLEFNRDRKEICLSINKTDWGTVGEKYTVHFHGVIGFEMTSCDFWGPSSHIDCFAFLGDDRVITPKLFKRKNEESATRLSCFLANKKISDFIETSIFFKSGDSLTIACEWIEMSATHGDGVL